MEATDWDRRHPSWTTIKYNEMSDKEELLLVRTADTRHNGRKGTGKLATVLRWLCAITALAIILYQQCRPWSVRRDNQALSPAWNSGSPIYRSTNSTIPWWPCPDAPEDEVQYCSVLRTPINWQDPVRGEDTEVFMRMYPAAKGKRMGSMLVNPGGPGGSGNAFVYEAGKSLGELTGGQYDIIGFDPRGVNMTRPRIVVAPTDFERAIFEWGNKKAVLAHDPARPFDVTHEPNRQIEMRRLKSLDTFYRLEKEMVDKLTPVEHLRSVSTASVARDMVAILDGLGENDGLLTYWGFSYGTVLGATFAAMFPERVGRMVLDGVANAEHYTSSIRDWAYSSLTDNQAVYEEFFRICADVGPARCALSPNSTFDSLDLAERAAMVKDAAFSLFTKLYEEPMAVPDGRNGPGLLSYDMYYAILKELSYLPKRWQPIAEAISQAHRGNGTLLFNWVNEPTDVAILKRGPRNDSDNVFGMPFGEYDVHGAIWCNDLPENAMELEDYLELGPELRERGFAGDDWLDISLPCRSWQTRPFERYSGPWHHARGLGRTRNKVLFVGNTFDPVTPLVSAETMAEGFGRQSASLLVQDGHGHCTTAQPSLCTIERIRAYFCSGEIPEWGTVCKSESDVVFPASSSVNATVVRAMERVQVAMRGCTR